jgi:hypothetical protein
VRLKQTSRLEDLEIVETRGSNEGPASPVGFGRAWAEKRESEKEQRKGEHYLCQATGAQSRP